MPQINEFYNKNRNLGLHIINILALKTDSDVWKKFHEDNNIKFIGTYFEGNNFKGYPIPNVRPHMYVIGADGKVKFEGGAATGLSWIKTAAKELNKVEYPFIGMRDVPKKLAKAAQYLSDGMFGKAHLEATKIGEESEGEAIIEYAEKITDNIESRVDRRFERVRTLKSLRQYHKAIEILEYLAGDTCKGMDAQQDAKDELKEIEEDNDAQAELKAWAALAKVIKKTEKKPNSEQRRALSEFGAENKGMAASDEAKEIVDAMQDSE